MFGFGRRRRGGLRFRLLSMKGEGVDTLTRPEGNPKYPKLNGGWKFGVK